MIMAMSSRLLAFVQVSSHQGLRQPEQAEKACCHEDERHGLSSKPVQSDRASFQDCPSPMVKGLRDCDGSVAGALKQEDWRPSKSPLSAGGSSTGDPHHPTNALKIGSMGWSI